MFAKLCFVYCGDDKCTCGAKDPLAIPPEGWKPMKSPNDTSTPHDAQESDASKIARLERELGEAFKLMTRYLREAGEARGRLEMSETAGIVDGWRERAQSAESRLEAARVALEPFAKPSEYMRNMDTFYLTVTAPPAIDAGRFWRMKADDFRRAREALALLEGTK